VNDVLVLLRVAAPVRDVPPKGLEEGRDEFGAAGLLVIRGGPIAIAVAGVALDEGGDGRAGRVAAGGGRRHRSDLSLWRHAASRGESESC
jgi:hypothetical protein